MPKQNICIDSGNNLLIPADVLDVDGDFSEPVPLDLLRNARQLEDPSTIDTGTTVSGCRVADMGAHEFTRPLCAKAHTVSSVPADWTIDARRPHPVNDASLSAREGIGSISEPTVITLDVSGSSSLQCWELCQSGPEMIEGGVSSNNQIASVTPVSVRSAPNSPLQKSLDTQVIMTALE